MVLNKAFFRRVAVLVGCLGILASSYAQLNVPAFSQSDSSWASMTLGGSNVTMATDGCCVTSVAMIWSYYGIQTDPGQVCKLFNGNGGLNSNGEVVWSYTTNPPVTYSTQMTGSNLSTVYSDLDSGHPVIAMVTYPNYGDHFIVLTGHSGTTVYCNDPVGGVKNEVVNTFYGDPSTQIHKIYRFSGQPPQLGNPTGSITYPSTDGTTVTGPITFTGTAVDTQSPVSSIQLWLDTSQLTSITPLVTNWSSWFNPAGYTYGPHTLRLVVQDQNGFVFNNCTRTFSYFSTPTGSITYPPSDGTWVTGPITITGTDSDPGASITSLQVLVNGTPLTTITSPQPNWSVWFNPAGYQWGTNTITLLMQNSNGVHNPPITRTFNHTSTPLGSFTNPAQDGTTLYGPITLTGTAGDVGTTVVLSQLFQDGNLLATLDPNATTWSSWFNPAGYAPGPYKFRLHVHDLNGMDGWWERTFVLPSGPFGSFTNPAQDGTTIGSGGMTVTGTTGDFSANVTNLQLYLDYDLLGTLTPSSTWSKWFTPAGYPSGTHSLRLYIKDASNTGIWITRSFNYQP